MLNVISLSDAKTIAETEMAVPQRTITLHLSQAEGMVLSEDVISGENVPAFDRSTMDGYAVAAADTFGAGQAIPAMLKIVNTVNMGDKAAFSLLPGQCAVISTGGMLPEGADAVVPVEYTEKAGDLCLCFAPAAPLQNVTRAGDDVKAGQKALSKGVSLSPAAVGVLAAIGKTMVSVYVKPRVGVISTGNELVPADRAPSPGEIRDVNTHLLCALSKRLNCECKSYGIIKDDLSALTGSLKKACAENDIVLLSGGSSAGEADHTSAAIGTLGTVFCHGIAVKPGKPTVLGRVGDTAVFGLPGHPAACFFMASVLLTAHLNARMGFRASERTVKASVSEHVSSNHGREELLCVRLEGERAVPLYAKSGVISLLSSSDGYIVIPRESEGVAAGTRVDVHLF